MDYIREERDLSRTPMEGLKFKLCHPLPERSVTQAYSTSQPHTACSDAFKKGRHSAVTIYPVQQINSMLFSQDVQGHVLILWQAKAISEVLHFKGRGWKVVEMEDMCSLGVGPGWLKASSAQTEPENQKNRELIVSQQNCLPLKVTTRWMKVVWLKRKAEIYNGYLGNNTAGWQLVCHQM